MDNSDLICKLCPGQPVFSDTSHLLTHVASKAHLSHQFKLGVRSHSEPSIAELIAAYNHWFQTSNIAQLLADRMSNRGDKNKRRSRARQEPSTRSTLTTPRPAVTDQVDATEGTMPTPLPIQAPIPEALPARTSANPADLKVPLPANGIAANAIQKEVDDFPDYIDPRLREPYNAAQQHDLTPEQGLGGHFKSDTGSTKNSPVGAADIATDSTGNPGTDTDSTNNPGSANWESPGPIADDLASQNASLPATPNGPDNEASTEQEIEADERARELTRLKGLVLPGMDIFDAAPEKMRRTRNQKKDGTAVKQLEKTSRLTEPTEQIFTPTGVLVKSRVISGNPDYDSPVEGESPISKKGAGRGKRGILQDTDPNVLIGKGRKRVKRDVGHGQGNDASENDNTDLFIYRNGSLVTGSEPRDDDLMLTKETLRQKFRAAFTVYRDTEERIEHMNQTVGHDTHIQQAQGHSSAPATLTLAQLDMTNNPDISHNHGHTTEAEQSIEASLDTIVYPPPPRWDWMTPIVNRSDAHMNNYPLRYLSNETSPAGSDLNNYEGYYRNPLRRPPSEPITLAYPSGDAKKETVAGWGGWTAASRALSSDSTMSEELDRGLSRL